MSDTPPTGATDVDTHHVGIVVQDLTPLESVSCCALESPMDVLDSIPLREIFIIIH